jgi:hypothetical protein
VNFVGARAHQLTAKLIFLNLPKCTILKHRNGAQRTTKIHFPIIDPFFARTTRLIDKYRPEKTLSITPVSV